MNAIKKYVKRALSALLLCYIVALVTLTLLQRQLLYLAEPSSITPEQAGLSRVENHYFSNDGERLQYWWRAPQPDQPCIVYFHGNAGSLGNRAQTIAAFAATGAGVAIMSYRGYGESSGSPTEQALYADADALMRQLMTQKAIAPQNIILFGESLGTGVATEMATRHKVAALVLQAPFTSVRARAQELYPWAPVGLLLRDRYESLEKIPHINMPLLLFHGLRDEVIPPAHSQRLFDAANEPKKLVLMEQVQHNDFPADSVAEQIMQFYALHRHN